MWPGMHVWSATDSWRRCRMRNWASLSVASIIPAATLCWMVYWLPSRNTSRCVRRSPRCRATSGRSYGWWHKLVATTWRFLVGTRPSPYHRRWSTCPSSGGNRVRGDVAAIEARHHRTLINQFKFEQRRATLCLHRGAPWIMEKPLLHNDSLRFSAPMHLSCLRQLVDPQSSADNDLDGIQYQCEHDRRHEQHADDCRHQGRHQHAAGREGGDDRDVSGRSEQHHPRWMRSPEMVALTQHVDVRLARENKHQKSQGLHLARVQAQEEPADCEHAQAIGQLEHAQWDRGKGQIADAPCIGILRWFCPIRSPRHRDEIARKHRKRLKQRRQDRVPRHDESGGHHDQRCTLVDENAQRISKHPLEG